MLAALFCFSYFFFDAPDKPDELRVRLGPILFQIFAGS